ncbi:amino acid deaminase [Kibdelosporangium phytohabitans]|uniref:Amino acid deaminase n=1 Tax=Kibdelosporangium phytohabitans TaxID=860235 RepID=A0A0N9ICJ0_9PSEU|nr:amino acid deaminase [Kibdelosporangium phytohabitans]ALG12322.1 amino acid deaminase [Kibdelosporangium phytohabitans]MBE1463882.1 D-serine deaminase-like pyridoxal phosphate-dependent protein [Kibdelosporangium phytohabitans]
MVEPARMSLDAVNRLADERIDWRFKGMPDALFGKTVAEALATNPKLFTDGFVGPLVVLDNDAIEHNLGTMRRWCESRGLALSPHGKTTMAPQLFQRQLEAGCWAITTANASQLRVYRAFGLTRILLANQLVDQNALRWLARELDGNPDFEFYCWADSVRAVELMTEGLAGSQRQVNVFVEVGAPGGRTGARTAETAEAVADAIVASPVLKLVGTAGWEGSLAHAADSAGLNAIDDFLTQIRSVTVQLADKFEDPERVIVTVGGSAYFDHVADALTQPWPAGLNVFPLLRSGAYVTHDDGFYRENSPLGAHSRIDGTSSFRSALRAWAQVTSKPEENLALLTIGKRDASFDEGLPEPQLIRRDGRTLPLTGAVISSLNDQHAYLEPNGADVRVGDWIGLGLSHPCTVFDKWQLLPAVGADGETVVDFIRTYF